MLSDFIFGGWGRSFSNDISPTSLSLPVLTLPLVLMTAGPVPRLKRSSSTPLTTAKTKYWFLNKRGQRDKWANRKSAINTTNVLTEQEQLKHPPHHGQDKVLVPEQA